MNRAILLIWYQKTIAAVSFLICYLTAVICTVRETKKKTCCSKMSPKLNLNAEWKAAASIMSASLEDSSLRIPAASNNSHAVLRSSQSFTMASDRLFELRHKYPSQRSRSTPGADPPSLSLSRKRSSPAFTSGASFRDQQPKNKGIRGAAEITSKANATFDLLRSPSSQQQDQLLPTSPHDFLLHMLQKHNVATAVRPSLSMPKGYFVQPTHQNMCNYPLLVNAVRARDIDQLRAIQQQGQCDDGSNYTLYCCNKFGESILHMACRRGFTEVVQFLLMEGQTSVRIVDDYGRTPLHDACWTASPNPDLMTLLITLAPELLLVSDKRGHTPLQYAQRADYPTWISYLKQHEQHIVRLFREVNHPNTNQSPVLSTILPSSSTTNSNSSDNRQVEQELQVVQLIRRMSSTTNTTDVDLRTSFITNRHATAETIGSTTSV
mmetsp:Transcript_14335/g.20536  ORF Transcript_14335/g.20536 Transcript_14335/m.20536 type:complete len:436 (-) Transcript_14335:1473-2780(-)